MYATGAKKDLADERDYPVRAYLSTDPIPSAVDLFDKAYPIRNQGSEPACVAFACAALKEEQEQAEGKNEGYFSVRFLYSQIALPGGGAYLRDALKILQTSGIPPEDCQPYDPPNSGACDKAVELAYPNRIKAYARLSSIEEVKRCLAEQGAVVASLRITTSWWQPKKGYVTLDGDIIGGHAVLIGGYSDANQVFKFRNQWGADWGDHGYGYISYPDFEKSLMDAWSSVDVPLNEEPKQDTPPIKTWWELLIEFIVRILKRR